MQMDLQAGDDLVYIFGVHGVGTRAQVPGVVSVDTGDGGDVLGANMENHNRIEIQLGSGRDELRLAATLHVLSVESDRTFDPNEPPIGSYSDNFDLLKVWLTAGGAVSIDTKYGIDEIILPRLITTSASATVDIQAKTGRIAVDLQTGTLKAPLRIVSGDGNDEIRIRNASVTGNVVVNSGRGHDFIRVENATISNRLSVWCGEGQDSLDIWGGVVADSSVLGGGDDYDVLQVVGDSNDLGELQVSGFEVQRGL